MEDEFENLLEKLAYRILKRRNISPPFDFICDFPEATRRVERPKPENPMVLACWENCLQCEGRSTKKERCDGAKKRLPFCQTL